MEFFFDSNIKKPQIRNQIRYFFGKKIYTLLRYLKWWQQRGIFATHRQHTRLDFVVYKHRSLILRPLKNVQMQYQHNKRTNLQNAIDRLDGIIIQPGQLFSFWYLVGQTTKRKGYKKGLSLRNGNIEYSYGGGLCQMGNLIYWMVLHSSLEVTERWRHSYDVFPDVNRKLPFGSGATLSYNYVDLQFFNPTNQPFQLKLWLDTDYLHGQLLSQREPDYTYKVIERNHRFESTSWGGFVRHNTIVKQRYTNNEFVDETEVAKNHAYMMYNPMLE